MGKQTHDPRRVLTHKTLRGLFIGRETTGSAGGGVPKKALASSIERSELLTANYQGRKTFVRTAVARLRAAGQMMPVK